MPAPGCLPDPPPPSTRLNAAAALFECTTARPAVQAHHTPGGVPDLVARLEAVLTEAFRRLRWAAEARGKLRDARRLLGAGPEGAPEAVPLVRQVLGKILLQVSSI
jgi:hypothetical protein